MRAERLLRIVDAIQTDYDKTGLIQLVRTLRDFVQNQANSPNSAYSTQISAARKAVYDALDKSSFNQITPSDARQLADLSMLSWVGGNLKKRIEEAFGGNDLVPSEVVAKLTTLLETIEKDYKAASGLSDGLSYFHFEDESLKPGNFELEITIPRQAFHNEVGPFGRELTYLNAMFGVFSEIATGSRENYKLNAISTSDPTILLASSASVATLVITTLDKIVGIYEKVLNVRKMHNDLHKQGVPEDVLNGLKDHIDKTVTSAIEQHAKIIDAEYLSKTEKGRRNELAGELRRTLRQIAERLDNGYAFDVRGQAPDPGSETDVTKLEQGQESARIINEIRPRLQNFAADSEPVLRISTQERVEDTVEETSISSGN